MFCFPFSWLQLLHSQLIDPPTPSHSAQLTPPPLAIFTPFTPLCCLSAASLLPLAHTCKHRRPSPSSPSSAISLETARWGGGGEKERRGSRRRGGEYRWGCWHWLRNVSPQGRAGLKNKKKKNEQRKRVEGSGSAVGGSFFSPNRLRHPPLPCPPPTHTHTLTIGMNSSLCVWA